MPNGVAPFAVPIVGQKLEIYRGYAQVTFLCKCHPENKPAMILGLGIFEVCNRCGSVYGISKFEFDQEKGHQAPIVTVRCFGKHPNAVPPGPPQ
jgi:hypothetical protein